MSQDDSKKCFFREYYKKSCSNWGKKKTNSWTLKVALHFSDVLLAVLILRLRNVFPYVVYKE